MWILLFRSDTGQAGSYLSGGLHAATERGDLVRVWSLAIDLPLNTPAEVGAEWLLAVRAEDVTRDDIRRWIGGGGA